MMKVNNMKNKIATAHTDTDKDVFNMTFFISDKNKNSSGNNSSSPACITKRCVTNEDMIINFNEVFIFNKYSTY